MFQQRSRRLLATPENPAPASYVYRRLRIPADIQWLMLVNGVFSLLLDEASYEATPDGVSIEDTTAVYRDMWLDSSASEGFWMLGAILPYAGAELPVNMLWCDGSQYLKADYPGLASILYGAFIDDATHFHVPDLRDKFMKGWTPAGTDDTGDSGGEAGHTLTVAEMPGHTHVQDAHNHTQNAHTHVQDAHNHTQNAHLHDIQHSHTMFARDNGLVPGNTSRMAKADGSGTNSIPSTQSQSTNNSGNATATNNAATATNQNSTATNNPATANNQNTGGGAAHNNIPPYLALRYVIIAR